MYNKKIKIYLRRGVKSVNVLIAADNITYKHSEITKSLQPINDRIEKKKQQ